MASRPGAGAGLASTLSVAPNVCLRRRHSTSLSQTRNFIDAKLMGKSGRVVPLSGYKFQEIWRHYDTDRSGFLEGKEIDAFLGDFLTSICSGTGDEVVTKTEVEEFKKNFMEEFDANHDEKISASELVSLLPVEESVYLAFRLDCGPTRGVDYMKIWHKYDEDNSGYIESHELKRFLRDIANNGRSSREQFPLDDSQLDNYAKTIMAIYDCDQDGRLSLSELTKLLPREENFVQILIDKTIRLERLTEEDVEYLIDRFDKNKTGTLDGEEITRLSHEVLALTNPDQSYTADDVYALKRTLLELTDANEDGQLDKQELHTIITMLARCRRPHAASKNKKTSPTTPHLRPARSQRPSNTD
ncbi:calbindin-32-like isoform X1 [Paramacrobiotus metropolitanus]|uniref:calbindin-32-like isoform X1 n=1 Tax=Paramacrobiotus metropolitanus TaxID=2943436 RepID=UPI0024462A5B|nr:calbindin-32-like isoform X1 [Paramacrobiotus metropolitanus]